MRLAFGSDHAGFELRSQLVAWAVENGHESSQFGAQSTEAYDYPDASDAVVAEIEAGRADLGVILCGSGIGVSIRANRHRGIRAALCCSPELAALARRHNYANVLCMGGRFMDREQAKETLRLFVETPNDEAERHARRVAKLDAAVVS